jgi:hypothetical protein
MVAKRASREPKPLEESRKDKVTRLLEEIEKKLKAESKATMSDYIRLLQLERELEENEPPREIIVTWIDSTGTHDGEE